MATEKEGGTFYYPDEKKNETTCRYEWHIPSGRKKLGIRLGLQFVVMPSGMGSIQAYAAYGDEHPNVGKIPSFRGREIARFLKEATETIEDALARLEENRRKEYYVTYFTELPEFCNFRQAVNFEQFGAVLLPTIIIGKENKRVSATICKVRSSFEEEAKGLALRNHMILCALLTLAEGAAFSLHAPEWPRNRKFNQVLRTIEPLPDARAVYPPRRWNLCQDQANLGVRDRASRTIEMYCSLSQSDRDDESVAPTAEPTSHALFSDTFRYSMELTSLESLARRALLVWLSDHSGIALNEELFRLGPLRFQSTQPFQARLTIPTRTIVQMKLSTPPDGPATGARPAQDAPSDPRP